MTKREQLARSRAAQALTALEKRGVKAVVTGSLATGEFGPQSDVDFLVISCQKPLKYKLESIVEDIMLDIPFDLSYSDELPSRVSERMAGSTVSADEIAGVPRE